MKPIPLTFPLSKSVFAILSLSTLFFFAACNSDSSCEPINVIVQEDSPSSSAPEIKSSSNFAPADMEISSSAQIESSSAKITSSSSASPESSSDDTQSSSSPAKSSSSINESNSASVSSSSAVFKEECIDFARMCRNCDGPDCPIPFRPCSECREKGMMAEDCVTGGVYQCKNGLWNLADSNQCLNVALVPCTGDSAKCGRKPCNSNAPKTVIDCGSGEEYVCADAYWTPMKETESCTRIIGSKNESEGDKCLREEAGARTVDCARNVEYECLSAGFWQQINPTIGDTCLVEGSILEGYIETSTGTKSQTIFMCFEGKWEKYRGTYKSMDCINAAVVRTPCDASNAENEWIHQDDCDYQCQNGEYVFVPKLADE